MCITKSITESVTPFKTKTRKMLILRVLQFKEVVPPGIERVKYPASVLSGI